MLSALLPLAALPLAAHALIDFPADNRMVQQPGLIRYPISVSAGAPSKSSVFRRQNDVAISSQKTGFFYSIQISIGTPPQAVSVNFDTGSNELWVNPVCSKSTDPTFCESFGRFNSSRTFVDLHKSGHLSYGTGNASLEYGYDYVQIGSARVSQQIFGVAADSAFAITGILGAGPSLSGWNYSYPLVIDNLAQQGFTNSRAFSLDIRPIDSPRGSVVFGGIDTKKFSGRLEKRPIIPAASSPDGCTRYWIYLDGISITTGNGSVVDVFDQPNGQPVLLDSGYTVSALPTPIFNKILAAFPDAKPPPRGSDLYTVPCSTGDSKGHVNFSFGETVIGVPYNDFIWHQPQYGICVLGVTSDDKFPVLGDTFLRAAYVVYDQDNRNIHLANTDDCGSNLVAIGKGPDAVPSVVGACGAQPTTTSSTTGSSSSKPTATETTITTHGSNSTVTSTAGGVGTTSQPVVTTSQPVVTTSQPVVTTSQPVVTTSQPVVTTSQPVVTTSQPVVTTSQPVATSNQHNTTAPATYTSTFTTRTTYTVTSCPLSVTGCPLGSVTTETITGTTTWSPNEGSSNEKPTVTAPPAPSITSVFTTTKTYTVTDCHGNGPCSKGYVTTEVVTSTTYLCPESTATWTIPRTHTCGSGEPGCTAGQIVTTTHVVTIVPVTPRPEPTPVPGCSSCHVPPPVATTPAEQTSSLPTTLVAQNSSLPTTPAVQTSSLPTTLVVQNSSLPTTLVVSPIAQTSPLPTTPAAQTSSLPATLVVQNSSLPTTLVVQTSALPTTPGQTIPPVQTQLTNTTSTASPCTTCGPATSSPPAVTAGAAEWHVSGVAALAMGALAVVAM